MAGLFSKKSKKDKEDRKNAAAAAAAVSAVSQTASTTTLVSNNNNQKGSSLNGPFRDNSSANNSIANSNVSVEVNTDKRMYQVQQQQQQQQQLNSHHAHTISNGIGNNSQLVSASSSTHNSLTNLSSASNNGPWISANVMSTNPFPRFSHTASYVHTGTDIYVFGGNVKGSAQKDMHVIDSQTLHCQYMPIGGADSPPATSGHTAVTLGHYIMYFGGKDLKNKSSDALYVLHTLRKEWNRPAIQGLLPAPRHSHAASVIGTTMFIFGGQFNGYYFNDICSFDMKSLNTANPRWNRLEPASELPPARAGHCAAAHDGKVYIFGGADEQFFYNDIWCYDPQANKWEAVPAFGVLPTSRQGHAACVIDDTMYIYGGMNHEDQLLGDLSAFKFNERRWLTYPDTLESASPRTEHAMCSVADKIYILGGQLELNAEDETGSIYILDTTKVRFNDPTPQRPGNETPNDITQRLEDHRPTPSPDSIRHIHDPKQQDSRRPSQVQHQLNDSSDQYSSAATASASSQLPIRMSLDGPESNPITRRRTTGKPSGHRDPEQDHGRATQSIDETRRPVVINEEHFERESSRSPSQRQQQQQDTGRRISLSDHRNRGSYNNGGRSTLGHSRTPSQQDSIEQLQESKDTEIRELRQREQWLMAEVAMSRKKTGASTISSRSFTEDTHNLAAAIALQDDMGAYDADQDSEKYRIMQALLSVKAELERSKSSIVHQAQSVSNKLREAERVRTAALQEAAYLKAKVSALQSGEVAALASTETARAVDLEKRLTTTLALVDRLQSQMSQQESVLERERHARELAQEREQEASERAEELQTAHSRSLSEVAALHDRASVAESNLRECETKNAANEAGLSSYQQQSAALFSQISVLKTTVDHQKKSLEKAKLAYSVANERAENVDRLWTQARQDVDNAQLEFANVRADLDRAKRESEHWKTKAQDTELLWQKAKSENEAMRTLLEEDMNAAATSPSFSPGSNNRKHDSIMAITSASRVAELEHELGTLRHLLRETQGAATQANKNLGETMVRISELENSVMTARSEANTAQRLLNDSEDKISSLESQLTKKEEALEEMAKEQENNEVQLGVLRGVMRENGLLADDLILQALSQSADGKPVSGGINTVTSLKTKVQEAEERIAVVESQLAEMDQIKKQQEIRIQQSEADHQTAVHYYQAQLKKMEADADSAESEKETLHAHFMELEDAHVKCGQYLDDQKAEAAALSAQFEEEVSDLHRQLHDALGRTMELEQKQEDLSRLLQESQASAEVTQVEFRTLKAKHHEHKKQGAQQAETFTVRFEQMESTLEETLASLAETRDNLETTLYDLAQANEMNKMTRKELDDALSLKMTLEEELKSAREATADAAGALEVHAQSQNQQAAAIQLREELEKAMENAQRTIQSLQSANEDLEGKLLASENKIAILLDNFQGPDSVRNSMASISGGSDDLIMRLMEANHHQLPSQRSSAAFQEQYEQHALQHQHQQQQQTQNQSQIQSLNQQHLTTPISHGSHLADRSSADSLANELELLKTPWGQAQINGGAYIPPINSTNNNDSISISTGVVGGGVGHPDNKENGAKSPVVSSATLGASGSESATSQKLEEYERMFEDMANVRRTHQYEE
ncbi:Negative regulator of mitotic exit [Podila humilis]|nr:Negative regulator of mitotic exit [Podila humilis]